MIGWRRVPAFRSIGIAGFHVAVAIAVLVGLREGLPLVTTLGLTTVAAFSFFGWGLLRRVLAGREALVLLEHVWVAFGAVALYLWSTGGPIVAGLDVLAVALCPFLLFGRLGCLTVGCCHGTPSSVGTTYPAWNHHPPWLQGVRLFPVPLVEAMGLALIGLAGFVLAGSAPGKATVWFLFAYASLRFGTEALRGDHRPSIGPWSVPRIMCLVQSLAAIVAAEAWLVPGEPGRATVIGAAVLAVTAVAGASLTAVRSRDPLVDRETLGEVWSAIEAAAGMAGPEPVTTATRSGTWVAVSTHDEGVHVSLSHPDHPTDVLGWALAGDDSNAHNGITHVHLEWRRLPGVRASVPPVLASTPGGVTTSPSPDPAGYFTRAI